MMWGLKTNMFKDRQHYRVQQRRGYWWEEHRVDYYNHRYHKSKYPLRKYRRQRTQSDADINANLSQCEQIENPLKISSRRGNFIKKLFNRTSRHPDKQEKAAKSPSHSWMRSFWKKMRFQKANEPMLQEGALCERAYNSCSDWIEKSDGRYEIIAHLDAIGFREDKNWFLLNDTTVRTNRLMAWVPLSADCAALEKLSLFNSRKEVIGSLQHPYIYPVLDMDVFRSGQTNCVCLVMPINEHGSLKDYIYQSLRWNEPWRRKYTKKSRCLTLPQVQRFGRHILEALLFLRERGIPSHGHLHSGNVILQNGVARLSGLENGLLGLSSKVNAIDAASNIADFEHRDVIYFGHLLFEMCAGFELLTPRPTADNLHLDLERYPKVTEVLQWIFESPDGRYPTVDELAQCDLFQHVELCEIKSQITQKQYDQYRKTDNTFQLCKICTENNKDIRLEPCGHLLCAQCLSAWQSDSKSNNCPFCRTEINGTEQIAVDSFDRPLKRNSVYSRQCRTNQ